MFACGMEVRWSQLADVVCTASATLLSIIAGGALKPHNILVCSPALLHWKLPMSAAKT